MTDRCPRSFFEAFINPDEYTLVSGDDDEENKTTLFSTWVRGDCEDCDDPDNWFFVKELANVMDHPDFLRRMIREVEVQMELFPEKFSTFRGFSVRDDRATLLFKYMKNGSLNSVRKADIEDNPFDVTKAACCMYGVTVLIEHMHSKNLAHRDIKGDNILMDDNFLPVLADFGWARSVGPCGGLTAQFGTPSFQAPEVIMCESLCQDETFACDIFSLGVLLSDLAGHKPFNTLMAKRIVNQPKNKKTIMELTNIITHGKGPIDGWDRPQYGPDNMLHDNKSFVHAVMLKLLVFVKGGDKVIQPELEQILRKCLEPVADDRPKASELRRSLEELEPNQMMSWYGKFPDKDALQAYKDEMREAFQLI